MNIDNDRVRVTTWTFEPGDRTGTHQHELPYVVIPVTGGRLRIESTEGANASTQAPGEPYFRDAGAQHDVINEGTAQLVFVEVELKN
ncbi:MAG TPA: cupin domain-containing protein [Nocardioidaceae bacterium]|nr:cupin domain-containing protein [Nocardioidaceae bacterium]